MSDSSQAEPCKRLLEQLGMQARSRTLQKVPWDLQRDLTVCRAQRQRSACSDVLNGCRLFVKLMGLVDKIRMTASYCCIVDMHASCIVCQLLHGKLWWKTLHEIVQFLYLEPIRFACTTDVFGHGKIC